MQVPRCSNLHTMANTHTHLGSKNLFVILGSHHSTHHSAIFLCNSLQLVDSLGKTVWGLDLSSRGRRVSKLSLARAESIWWSPEWCTLEMKHSFVTNLPDTITTLDMPCDPGPLELQAELKCAMNHFTFLKSDSIASALTQFSVQSSLKRILLGNHWNIFTD